MATIDDRVVQLKFDNKQFESATAQSMSTLDKLKQSLNFSSSKKGIEDVSNAIGRMNIGSIATTIEGINAKFLAMSAIAVTAISNITSKVIALGSQMIKSLTLDPIMAGFKDYETQINATQTVMANTGLEGAKGLAVVTKTLKDLNEYANLTIYDFSMMTQNIGRFTAAGVAIKPATDAIKGMANVAALTGASTEQLGSAMYQMSQALATGTIRLMDWNSLANANMGTQNMQKALMATARTLGDHGKAMDSAIKKQGNFRDSLTEGWLTSEIFTKTMGVMAGTLDKATGKYRAFNIEELKGMGYTEEQARSLQKLSQAAIDSAINIRTMSQLMEALREGVATAWGDVFKTIFGNIFEATNFFTGLYNVLYNAFTAPVYKLDEFLKEFQKLGGMKVVIQAVKNAFAALGAVLKPIKDAFRQIFPPTTAKELLVMATAVRDFFAELKIGPETAEKLRRTFAGFFAIFSIGKSLVSGFIGIFVDLFKSFSGVGGSVLDLTANIGDFFVKVDQAIKNGALIPFFSRLNELMVPVNNLIRKVSEALQSLFSGSFIAGLETVETGFGRITQRLSPLEGLASTLSTLWYRFIGVLQNLSPVFQQVIEGFRNMFAQIPVMIQESVENGNYSAMLDTINTAIFGGIALMIRKFIKGGGADLGGGLLSSITSTFGELTNTLKAMQEQIKSKVLLNIAIAVGILTASVVALSLIDSAALTKALTGLAVTFTELMVAMKVLDNISKSTGFLKLPFIAGSLILLSTAILILTGAVKVLSTMNWEELGKGMTGLAGILAMLDLAVKPLAANSSGLITAGAGLILVSGSLLILSGAMKIFSTMSWEEIGKGLTAVVGSLTAIALAVSLMPPNLTLQAAGLVLVAGALAVLSGAMSVFATMSWEQIGKGLAAVLGSLTAIAVAMSLMPGPMMIATAAGLVLVALALNGIAAAMKIMASMSWEEIGKGLVGIAGALVILAGGLYLMTGTLAGAAALVVAAGALMILAPAIALLGSMSWEAIGKGLLTLAGAFAIIGLAGLVLTPVIPSILGLAGAIALLGAGMALIGVGVLAFATAISMLVAVGSLGVVALTAILQTVIGIIPTVMKALELAIVAFAEAVIAATPKVIEAIVVVLTGLMDAIIRLTPKIYETLGVLLDGFLAFIVKYIPKLVDAGMQIINGILKGIKKNLPSIIKNGTDVIIAWIKGMGKAAADIAIAAGEALLGFMVAVTQWIDQNKQIIEDTSAGLGRAIVEGIIAGIKGMITGPLQAIGGLVNSVIERAKSLLESNSPSKVFERIGRDVVIGFVNGIVKGKSDTVSAVNAIAGNMKSAIDEAKRNVADLKKQVADLSDKPMTKANKAALAKAKAALKAAEGEQARLTAAYKTLTVEHKAQINQLVKLAAQYDVVKAKLDKAQSDLDEAIKKRDDYAKSISDKYGSLPQLDATSSLDDYFNAIREATAANIKFKATLEQLRSLGLDDNQYRKFMEQGTQIQPFLDALLASGGDTITELNKIDMSLTESATSLGKSASEALYQAGVDAAQGIVDGLTTQMKAITDKMTAIGKAIADEIKKELGIKSPSKVLAEVGKNTILGLVKGIEDNSNIIDISTRRMGLRAAEGFTEALKGISDIAMDEIDLQPRIAPVIDLTEFKKGVVALDKTMAGTQVNVGATVSTNNADIIAAVTALNQRMTDDLYARQTGTTVELTQNNYSPKALSSAEIYRQTRNQLSILKEV